MESMQYEENDDNYDNLYEVIPAVDRNIYHTICDMAGEETMTSFKVQLMPERH
jgi:hypothetical protein